MTKNEFKNARSLYRYYLRQGGNLFTRKFNITFGVPLSEVAFCDTGCKYEDSFSWAFGNFKSESIIYRNVENINFG